MPSFFLLVIMVQFNELRIIGNSKLIIDISVKDLPYYKDVYLDTVSIDTQDTFTPSGPSEIPVYKYTVSNTTERDSSKHAYINGIEITGWNIYTTINSLDSDFYLDNMAPGEYVIDSVDRDYFILESLEVFNNSGIHIEPSAEINWQGAFDASIFKKGDILTITQGPIDAGSTSKSLRLEISKEDILASLEDDLLFVYIKTTGTPTEDTPCGEDNIYTLGVTFYPDNIYKQVVKYAAQVNDRCNIPRDLIDLILRYEGMCMSLRCGNYTQGIQLFNLFKNKCNGMPNKPCLCNK